MYRLVPCSCSAQCGQWMLVSTLPGMQDPVLLTAWSLGETSTHTSHLDTWKPPVRRQGSAWVRHTNPHKHRPERCLQGPAIRYTHAGCWMLDAGHAGCHCWAEATMPGPSSQLHMGSGSQQWARPVSRSGQARVRLPPEASPALTLPALAAALGLRPRLLGTLPAALAASSAGSSWSGCWPGGAAAAAGGPAQHQRLP